MSDLTRALVADDPDQRREHIVTSLTGAFSELMARDPVGFRRRFRKMVADPFTFYRGSAFLFYADVERLQDPWADERTSRVWIQGDLHAENFGTYMDGTGTLIFDVNDFDEAFVGRFTWDLQRLAASIGLLGWSKALPDEAIEEFVHQTAHAYIDQVHTFAQEQGDAEFALRLDTTDGAVHQVLQEARLRNRHGMLQSMTETAGHDRRFREGHGVRRLDPGERDEVVAAYARYLDTIPENKRMRGVAYTVKDVVGRSGFGIGSAGLPAYNVLIEGENQALETDLVLSVKQGNVAAPSRIVRDERIHSYFEHHGQRTAVSQRALQAHADPLLGHTELHGRGHVVSEISPYERDLDWSNLTEPEEIAPVLHYLGRAAAKIHCVSDTDSDHTLVPFQTEEAIENVVGGREEEFARWLARFAVEYADIARQDHRLFVEAFRGGDIPGVRATSAPEWEPPR